MNCQERVCVRCCANTGFGRCGDLDENGLQLECLAPSWWNCMGKIRRQGLVGGGGSLGVGFDVSEVPGIPS